MPSNEVYQLIQDNTGYIYIGCSEGVFKYDGFNFKSISSSRQNAKSVSHFIKDKNGKIWCQNFSGQIYCIQDDSLVVFKDLSKENVDYPQFTVDDSANIWLGIKKELVKIRPDGSQISFPVNSMQMNGFMFLNTLKGKIVYSIMNQGLFMFDIRSGREEVISMDDAFLERTNALRYNDKIYILCETNPEKYYDYYEWDGSKLKKLFHINSNFIAREIYQIRPSEDGYWVCTSNGAYFFSRSNLNSPQKHLFQGDEISSSIEDKEGNVWFSSLAGGIYMSSMKSAYVHKVENELSKPFTSMYTHPEFGLFVGDISGTLYREDTAKGLQSIKEEAKEGWRRVSRILYHKGKYYISRNYLFATDFKGNSSAVKTNYIRDMSRIGDSIYIITSVNFGCYRISTKSFEIISELSARKLASDTLSNTIFISSGKGVQKYRHGVFSDVLWNGRSLQVAGMICSDGILWVNTLRQGVVGFKNGLPYRQYFKNESLKNRIKCITARDEFLFIVTEKGVYKINHQSEEKSFIGRSLQVNLNGIIDCHVANDRMYLLSSRAVFSFPLNYFGFTGNGPLVQITKVKSRDGADIDTSRHFFKSDFSSLEIHFKAFSYSSLGNLYYKYRLLGSNSEWKDLQQGVDHVLFESVPSGSYTFEVVAINSDGVESESPARYLFVVDAPIYKKGWFMITCSFVFLFIIYMIYKWQIARIRKKALLEKSIAESKLKALKAQMNPHFMFNALNSIQDLILKQDIKSSNLYLSKFSNLTRKILEFSENETILIEEELEMLKLYLELEKLRFGDEFSYEINIGQEINIYTMSIPSLILQPFVENAIKHGLLHKKGVKKCEITFDLDANGLIIWICDNGIGRKRSDEIKKRRNSSHRSFATSAVLKRIDLLNTDRVEKISIQIVDLLDNGDSAGTKVIVNIPKEFMN